MRWARGDLSFIFNGEDDRTAHSISMVVLDNQTKEYQRMKLLGSMRRREGREGWRRREGGREGGWEGGREGGKMDGWMDEWLD